MLHNRSISDEERASSNAVSRGPNSGAFWGRSLRLGSQKLWLDVHRFKLDWHTVTCQGRACGNQACHQTKALLQPKSEAWNVSDATSIYQHCPSKELNNQSRLHFSLRNFHRASMPEPHDSWWIRLWPFAVEIIHGIGFHFSVSSLEGQNSSHRSDESLVNPQVYRMT